MEAKINAYTGVNIINNKDGKPLEHYLTLFRELSPDEVSRRCGFEFSGAADAAANAGVFRLMFLNQHLSVSYPMLDVSPKISNATKILLLRHMLEGRLIAPSGRFLTYREMPWGALYDANFQGRCVKRLAFSFGTRLNTWAAAMRSLGAIASGIKADAAYDLEILPLLTVRFIIWEGEAEENISPAAQILFSDNFSEAFSAEDMAVVCDLAIDAMKTALAALPQNERF
jgi:hypothetical protein